VVKDSVGVIRQIYEYFDYPFGDEFEARIARWPRDNRREKHGIHRYSLEQFGLTPEGVDRLFSDYSGKLGMASDWRPSVIAEQPRARRES
jgi:hypothetical protein